MNKYKEYSKIRKQIELLTIKKLNLEKELLDEVILSPDPISTSFGTFSKVKHVVWIFPDKISLQIEALKAKIKEVKEKNIKSGEATSITSFGFRFTKIKKETKL